MLFLRPFEGQKGEIFNWNCLKSFCKIVLPAEAGSIILKNCDSKSELEHWNHKRGVLKLAILMQIRNESWSAQLFYISLGECRAKWKSQKRGRCAFWCGRAECAGALEETFEGVRDLQMWIEGCGIWVWILHASACLRQGRRIAPCIPLANKIERGRWMWDRYKAMRRRKYI